jgi:hypothetical protein
MSRSSKPRGINILALLICIGGVMDLYNFFWTLMDPTTLSFFFNEAVARLNFYISLPVGLFSLVVAYGFFKGCRWGWGLGFVSSFVGILLSLITLLGRSLDPVIVAIIIINAVTIYYLTRPHVKRYFRRPAS